MDRSSHSSKSALGAARRFRADRGGNFAIVTAVVFVPLLMSIAAVADISLFYRDRTAVQSAADAAALAAAKQFALTPDAAELQRYAQSVFSANTQGLTRTTSVLKYEGTEWTPGGTRELRISACSSYDPFFLSALRISFPGLKGSDCSQMQSVVAVGSTTVEVAFVLDTSGSMGDSPAAGGEAKIATLRTQATKAINTIFGSGGPSGSEDPVRVGIVPFSGGVNVGPEHLNDWWMDPKGLSPIHHENLSWGGSDLLPGMAPGVIRTRQLIYASLGSKNADWAYRGCVESRPAKHALLDTPPTELDPTTLYVPFFAPDEPDDSPYSFRNSYVRDGVGGLWSNPSYEEKTRKVGKYFLNVQSHGRLGANYINSPSFMCDSPSLTPLTKDKSKALGAVRNLTASGATNVPQGVEWGWKVLSKNEPFTEGRAAGEENNIKAMIVMTDGQNTYYNSYSPAVSAFGAYGYTGYDEPGRPSPGVPRLFDYKAGVSTATTDANYTAALNGRLAAICENAKGDGRIKLKDGSGAQLKDERGPVSRDGILIYTIAFDIPLQYRTMVNGLLQGCASYKLNDLRNTSLPYRDKGKYFYSASNAKDLETAFSDIMASLTNLRIAR
ncbi:pilus assembly protein [Aureimonas ureilytica]|uniref:pilus assembly protein n=1 Tax=Aureimonas ureilytica TaxID=401562 RepID=UPI0003A4A032|nr:pilus assembly protein [Aureimonas ureilytica]